MGMIVYILKKNCINKKVVFNLIESYAYSLTLCVSVKKKDLTLAKLDIHAFYFFR